MNFDSLVLPGVKSVTIAIAQDVDFCEGDFNPYLAPFQYDEYWRTRTGWKLYSRTRRNGSVVYPPPEVSE